MTAVVPSADSATEEPKLSWSTPAELVRVAVGVEEVAQDPSPETWNSSAAPVYEPDPSVPGAPTRAVVPSADSATETPKKSPEASPELLRVPVGVAMLPLQDPSPETLNT